MRKISVLLFGLWMPVVAFAWPWSIDMVDQPSIKPQEGVMAPFPVRSIPVMGNPTEVADREAAKELKSPFAPTAASLKEGRTLYRIYCAACHGMKGGAESPVSGKIGAIALNDDYAQDNLTEGWIFGTITFGSFIMPAYGKPKGREDLRGSNDLSVEERWHVVNYVKHGLMKDQESPAVTTAGNP